MRTRSPISTISFNTLEFLELKLCELENCGKISFWAYVRHLPEDDEAGNKEHMHVYIEPSKQIQTDDFRKQLLEFDPNFSEDDYAVNRLKHDNVDDHELDPDVSRPKKLKPRGCLLFRCSKFADWYLYGLHDKRYLAMKGQSRKYHYSYDDIVTSSPDDLLCMSRSINLLALSPYSDMEEAQRNGVSFAEYFRRGTVPLQQVALFERAWYLLLNHGTDRGGRETHSPRSSSDVKKGSIEDYAVLNKKTGEFLEVDENG